MNFLGMPLYVFQVRQDAQFESNQSLYLTNALLTLGRVAFQIVARPTGIQWQVADWSGKGIALESLKVHNVAVNVAQFSHRQSNRFPFFRSKLYYKMHTVANRPILYITDIQAKSDPLIQFAQTVSYLQDDEEVRYTLIITGQYKPLFYQTLAFADRITKYSDKNRYPHKFLEVIEHKQRQPWYAGILIVDIDSPHYRRADELRQAIDLQLSSHFDRKFSGHPLNGLRSFQYDNILKVDSPQNSYWTTAAGEYQRVFQQDEIKEWFDSQQVYFEAAELAALWHLPHKEFQGTNVIWRKPNPVLPLTLAQNSEGIVLGQAIYHDERKPVRISVQDRVTHLNVIGRTGVGKSTFMHHLIHQDIQNGEGVTVIDPHGSLVQAILRCSIPKRREKDVVVLDLNQPDYPMPLNIFDGAQSYAAIGRVVDSIERLYTATGVRMDKYLRAGVRALQYVPGATMRDLYLLLTDAHFRYTVLERVEDDETFQALHDEYHALSDGQQRTIRSPILNRISPFYANPYLYPCLCHPRRIDFEKLVDERRIILIALGVNAEQVPQKERDLVGALIISLIQMVGMKPNRNPMQHYMYVDEVQNFVTSSLETVFSEARKYGLLMTVAHQFFGQLASETVQAIMGNVGTTVAFRSNVDDARALGPYMHPQFEVQTLVNLDKYQAAVKMQHHGETQDAFMLYPAPPLPEPDDAIEREKRIRAMSAKQYIGMGHDEVKAWLDKRYPNKRRIVKPPSAPLVADLNPDDFVE